MSDPWLPERLRAEAGLARHENSLIERVFQAIKSWLARLRSSVQPTATVLDPAGVFAASPALQADLDDAFEIEVREIIDAAHNDVTDDGRSPESEQFTLDYLRTARNRIVGAPERTYNEIRQLVSRAAVEGWSIEELADEVQQVIGDAALPMWHNRATVIARTEAISAYNAGTYAGFLSLAAQLGGQWEKGWLATHDERTRETHRGADLQRVPLRSPFRVGAADLMFPGDPRGPAHEVIQCRCTLILLRPGETINAANREYRESA